jgi:hypothetical protein
MLLWSNGHFNRRAWKAPGRGVGEKVIVLIEFQVWEFRTLKTAIIVYSQDSF